MRDPALSTAPRTSRALCEAILNLLGRDDALRPSYVRRRWHGCVEFA